MRVQFQKRDASRETQVLDLKLLCEEQQGQIESLEDEVIELKNGLLDLFRATRPNSLTDGSKESQTSMLVLVGLCLSSVSSKSLSSGKGLCYPLLPEGGHVLKMWVVYGVCKSVLVPSSGGESMTCSKKGIPFFAVYSHWRSVFPKEVLLVAVWQ